MQEIEFDASVDPQLQMLFHDLMADTLVEFSDYEPEEEDLVKEDAYELAKIIIERFGLTAVGRRSNEVVLLASFD